MKRATLYISGNVQRAVYRSEVISIAKKYDIKGNIQNLSDGNVKIIAEADENDLGKFIKEINIKNTLINVTDIKKEYSEPTGEYENFYKLVSEGETDERLDTAASLLKELINVTKNGFDRLEKKQDVMIEKQDDTIDIINQSRIEIKSEIHGLRDDFKSYFDERLSKMEFELAEIKAKVAAIHHGSSSSNSKISQTE